MVKKHNEDHNINLQGLPDERNLEPKKKRKYTRKSKTLLEVFSETGILNEDSQIIISDPVIEKESNDLSFEIDNQLSKVYVLDTSVILNDVNNIYILSQDNSNVIIIPETVLDEIDHKKKGFNDINFQAREFNRIIDQAKVFDRQVVSCIDFNLIVVTLEIDKNVKIKLVSKDKYSVNVNNELISIVNDRKILEVAQSLPKFDNRKVVVVSNDIALRARAISLNLHTQPLLKNRTSEVEDISLIEVIEITSSQKDLIDIRGTNDSTFNRKFSNFTNVVFKCTDTNEQILTFYKHGKFHLLNEKYLRSFPVKPKNKEQLFFMNLLLDKDVPIVVCSGVTGSGKNLLALFGGLDYIKNQEQSRLHCSIKYCRNTVTAGDDVSQLGFLKGDESQKLSVFSYPLVDSVSNYIDIIQNNNKNSKTPVPIISSKQFMEDNSIEVLNINQMRGSNIYGYLILDEWQNSSSQTTKLMLTRINDGAKVIILGDLNQIDHPHLSKFDNGLSSMLKHAKNHDMVAGIKLNKVQRGKIAEFAEKNF